MAELPPTLHAYLSPTQTQISFTGEMPGKGERSDFIYPNPDPASTLTLILHLP